MLCKRLYQETFYFSRLYSILVDCIIIKSSRGGIITCKILKKDDSGFAGLHRATALIAFLIVAAVFSYVMLGAGFSTTQRSQELLHRSVQQASGSPTLSGDVYARSEAQNGVISFFSFYVKNTAGGTPIDLNKTLITYTDQDDCATTGICYLSPTNSSAYYIPLISNGSADNLVEEGETYRINLVLPGSTLNLSSLPGENEVVKLEVKPPEGGVLTIQRRMPPSITANTNYLVYQDDI